MLRDSRLIAPLSPIQKMKNVQYVIDQRDSGVLLNYHTVGLKEIQDCVYRTKAFCNI